MELEKLLHNVESRIVRAGKALWQADPKTALRDQADRVSDELRGRHETLERSRAERAALQRKINDDQQAADVLTNHIQTCLTCGHGDQAWQFALQLDRLRQGIADCQAQLPRLDQVCWSIQFQIRQMERQLARLHEQVYPR
jgi:phage shock protein A